MSHYTLATPLDTWQKIRDDMTAKGVDPDVALANAKETPATNRAKAAVLMFGEWN